MKTETKQFRHRTGFSLVEVIIAITVIAGGLLVLIAVFPGALRLGTAATADSRQSAFAENVFGTIQLKAAQITDCGIWMDRTTFWNQVGHYRKKDGGETSLTLEGIAPLDGHFVDGEKGSYYVTLRQGELDKTIWNITVYCSDTPDIPATNCTPYQLSLRFRQPVN